jgi:hypothetical protein
VTAFLDPPAVGLAVMCLLLGAAAGLVVGIALKVSIDRAEEADRRWAGYLPPVTRRELEARAGLVPDIPREWLAPLQHPDGGRRAD